MRETFTNELTCGWTTMLFVFRWFSDICRRFGQWSFRWCLTACIFKISFFVESKSYSRQKDEENQRLWICQFQGATRLFESYARNEWLVFLTKFIFWCKYFAESNRFDNKKFKIYDYVGTLFCIETFVKFLGWSVFFFLFVLFLRFFNGNHLFLFLLCTANALKNLFSKENI